MRRVLITERRKATCAECHYYVNGMCCFDRESKPVIDNFVCEHFESNNKNVLYHFDLERQDRIMRSEEYTICCDNCVIECKKSSTEFCREFRPEPIPTAIWRRR